VFAASKLRHPGRGVDRHARAETSARKSHGAIRAGAYTTFGETAYPGLWLQAGDFPVSRAYPDTKGEKR